jgi:hypothetical protein
MSGRTGSNTRFVARFTLILLLAVSGILPADPSSASEPHKAKVTGTFTNLKYLKEAGDLLGYEIRVLFTQKGYYALVQVASGGAGVAVLEPVRISEERLLIAFKDHPFGLESFEGAISQATLTGKFRFTTGTAESVSLKRGKSYWD